MEEQFYVFFPALLALAWVGPRGDVRRAGSGRFGRRGGVVAVGVVGALSFAAALWGASGRPAPGPDVLLGFYSPFTRAWEFAVGALVALTPVPRLLGRGSAATLLGALGMAAVLLSLGVIGAGTPWPGPVTLLPVLGTAAVIAAGADARGGRNIVTLALSTPAAVTVGNWSYSLYLWHWPFVVAATMLWPHRTGASLVAAVLSVLPAVASYRLLEQPLRRDPRLGGRRLARTIAVATVPPVLLAAGLYVGSGRGWWSPTVRQYVDAVATPHAGRERGCDQRVPLAQVGPECTWGVEAPGAPLYLLGDSNADHFSEAVIGAGRVLGRPVTVATTNACPFLDVAFLDDRPEWASRNAACARYVQETLTAASTVRPGTIVLANSDVYGDKPEIAMGPSGGALSHDAAAKGVALREGLARTIRSLRAAGHRVLVVQSTPKWVGAHAWTPDACTTVGVLTGSCRSSMTVADAEAQQGMARSAVREAVASAGAPSAGVASARADAGEGAAVAEWDTWAQLCPDGVCATHAGDLLRYRDASHLSVAQSTLLTDPLVARLQVLR